MYRSKRLLVYYGLDSLDSSDWSAKRIKFDIKKGKMQFFKIGSNKTPLIPPPASHWKICQGWSKDSPELCNLPEIDEPKEWTATIAPLPERVIKAYKEDDFWTVWEYRKMESLKK